jgi:cytidyltransferase-like protein
MKFQELLHKKTGVVFESKDVSALDTPRKPLTKIHQLTGTPLRTFIADFKNGLESASFVIKVTPKIDGHPFRVAWIDGNAFVETGYSGLMGKDELSISNAGDHVKRFFNYIDKQDKTSLFAELKKYNLTGVKIVGELLANSSELQDNGTITYVGTTYDATKLGKFGSVVIIEIKGATMDSLENLDETTATKLKTFLASKFSNDDVSYFDIDQFAQKILLKREDFPQDLIEKLDSISNASKVKKAEAEEIRDQINIALTEIFKSRFENPDIMPKDDKSLEGVAFELNGNLYGIHYQSWKDIRHSYYADIDEVKEFVQRFLARMIGKPETTLLGSLISEIRSNIETYQPMWEKSYKEFLKQKNELIDRVLANKSLPKFVQQVGQHRIEELLNKFKDEDINSDINSLLNAIMPMKNMNGKTIAIIPGSFRPPHKGHFEMIRHYASIADEVIVPISGQATVSSRRPDKFGRTMPNYIAGQILKLYCDAYGLTNVKIQPVMKLMQWVSWRVKSMKNAKIIFGVSDKDDVSRFSGFTSERFMKQNPTLEILPVDEYVPQAVKVDGEELSASWVRQNIDDKEAIRKIVPDNLSEEDFEKVFELMNPKSGNYPSMIDKTAADQLFAPESNQQELMTEGGAAVPDVMRIKQENVQATLDDFKKAFCDFVGIDEKFVQPLGSTGKRAPGHSSGDLDVGVDLNAVRNAGHKIESLDDWYALCDEFLKDKTYNKFKGIRLVSVRWPIVNVDGTQENQFVQIDIFPHDNLKMLEWGMYQTPEEPGKDFDKSAVRALLLQSIAKYGFTKVLETADVPDEGPNSPVKIYRWLYKQTDGLYELEKERTLKRNGKYTLWKEVKGTRKKISDDPDTIVKKLFGDKSNYKSDDLLSVRQVWDAFVKSDFYKDKEKREEILKGFKEKMEEFEFPVPKYVHFNESLNETEQEQDSKSRVAVIITDGTNVIVGQTPQRVKYGLKGNCDLPKGHAHVGEDLKDAAIREVREEIGVKLPSIEQISGKCDYLKGTTITFFKCVLKELPHEESLKCNSFFTYKGKEYPEIVAYHFVPLSNLTDYLYKNLAKTLKDNNVLETVSESNSYSIHELSNMIVESIVSHKHNKKKT